MLLTSLSPDSEDPEKAEPDLNQNMRFLTDIH